MFMKSFLLFSGTENALHFCGAFFVLYCTKADTKHCAIFYNKVIDILVKVCYNIITVREIY